MVTRRIDGMRLRGMDALGRILYRMLTEDDSLADSPGTSPERSEDGHFGSECDGCPVNLIWKDEHESWCGCARPGFEVLPCGHCACGNGLCLELVRNGSTFEARRKVTCR